MMFSYYVLPGMRERKEGCIINIVRFIRYPANLGFSFRNHHPSILYFIQFRQSGIDPLHGMSSS